MDKLFTLHNAKKHAPEIDHWLSGEPHDLHTIGRHWFSIMRSCGQDVRELMHDGYAVACVHNAPFAYIGIFTNHVNVGFFMGAMLSDRNQLMEGTGKRMRHVKLRPDGNINSEALETLIHSAYADMKTRLSHHASDRQA